MNYINADKFLAVFLGLVSHYEVFFILGEVKAGMITLLELIKI
jgi:hypothetical protein